MQEENDVRHRQTKAFAQGLGYLLAKGGGKFELENVFHKRSLKATQSRST